MKEITGILLCMRTRNALGCEVFRSCTFATVGGGSEKWWCRRERRQVKKFVQNADCVEAVRRLSGWARGMLQNKGYGPVQKWIGRMLMMWLSAKQQGSGLLK